MAAPLVSIITPTFNHVKFIRRCVESVVSQAYENWEQIIVDDGSCDGTGEIVAHYRDSRIRYVHLTHRGLSALAETYNIALELAKGELVALLEGDDFWPEEKLVIQVPVFEDDSVYLAWGKGGVVDEQGRVVDVMRTVKPGGYITKFTNRQIFRALTMGNILTPTVTTMVRRSALQRIGGFQQTGSTCFVDLPTWLFLTGTCEGLACFVNDILGCWRVYAGQVTNTHSARIPAEHLSAVLGIAQRLESRQLEAVGWGPEITSRAVAAAAIREGRDYLKQGELKDARKRFLKALGSSADVRQTGRAILGLLSTVSRVDWFSTGKLVARLFRLH